MGSFNERPCSLYEDNMKQTHNGCTHAMTHLTAMKRFVTGAHSEVSLNLVLSR